MGYEDETQTLIEYDEYIKRIKEEFFVGFTVGVVLTAGIITIGWLIF